LGKFAWKPILSALKERENNIADSLATAQKVKAEMAQLKVKMKHCWGKLATKEQG
jgi:F-type H+-transporting ATPase subunit b